MHCEPEEGDRVCFSLTFIFVMPRSCAYAELKLAFVDFVYLPDHAAVEDERCVFPINIKSMRRTS